MFAWVTVGLYLIVTVAAHIISEDKCITSRIHLGNNFYSLPGEISRLNAKPGRILFLNGRISYEKNGVMIDQKTGRKSPYIAKKIDSTIIQDQLGNKMFIDKHNDILVYLAKNKQVFKIQPNIKDARFSMSFDHRNVFVTGNSPGGFVYMTDISNACNTNNDVITLTRVDEMGKEISSMAVDPLDGRIIFVRNINKKSVIYLMKKLRTDPCIKVEDRKDADMEFMDTLIQSVDEMLLTHQGNMMYDFNTCEPSTHLVGTCGKVEDLKTIFDVKLSQIKFAHQKVIKELQLTNDRLMDKLKKTQSVGKQCGGFADKDIFEESFNIEAVSYKPPKYNLPIKHQKNSNKHKVPLPREREKDQSTAVHQVFVGISEASGDGIDDFFMYHINPRFGIDD